MQLKLAGLRKGEVSTGNKQKSEDRRTRKAIRTLEYKLDRVSHETQYNENTLKTDRSHIITMLRLYSCSLFIYNTFPQAHILTYYCIVWFAYFLCLAQALTCFNEQLTRNSQLREELQSLHIERVRFQQLQKRLDKVRGHTTDDFFCLASLLFSPLLKHLSALALVGCRNCTISARRSGKSSACPLLLMMSGQI